MCARMCERGVFQLPATPDPGSRAVNGHMVTTAARWLPCPECRAGVIVGVAEGISTAVDGTPLEPLTEIAALAAGTRTFNFVRTGSRIELWHRDQWRIRSRKYPVLPEHACALAATLAETPVKRKSKQKKLRSLDEAVNAQLQLPMKTDQSIPF